MFASDPEPRAEAEPWAGASEDDWHEWATGDPSALIPTMANTAPNGLFALELDTALRGPLTGVTATDLIDAAIGYERIAAWAAAQQARVLAEFARRPADGTVLPAGVREPRAFAADEVSLALTLAPQVGAQRLAHAERMDGVLRPTRDALAAGRICAGRARLVCQMLADHDDDTTAAVQARVLPGAGKQTWSQLRAAITKALLAVVPDQAERHRKAKRKRSVELYPGQDGMATLVATLTATDATACFGWLTRLARGVELDHPGQSVGSMDQRRADVLVALLTGRLTATRQHADSADAASTAGASATNATNPTGTLTEHGPTGCCDTAGALHERSTSVQSGAGGGSSAAGQIGASDAAGGCGAAGKSDTPGESADPAATHPVHAVPVNALRPLVQVVVPITTLMGIGEEPAELAGYGPIPAHLARQIAADPTSVWQRLLTDPTSGRLLDVGRERYRPPPGMAAFVRARDGECRHPTCRRSAVACELDHVVEWQHDGRTCEANLCALCARHHDLKEHHGWHVVLRADRTVEWTTPTGHRYTSAPVDHRIPPPIAIPPPAGRARSGPGTAALLTTPTREDDTAPF